MSSEYSNNLDNRLITCDFDIQYYWLFVKETLFLRTAFEDVTWFCHDHVWWRSVFCIGEISGHKLSGNCISFVKWSQHDARITRETDLQ